MAKILGIHVALNASDIERRVRQIAADSAKIKWTAHARERMAKRGVTIQEATHVLRAGHVSDEPTRTAKKEITCTMVKQRHGSNRDIGVVTIIVRGDVLIIKTVEFEDFR